MELGGIQTSGSMGEVLSSVVAAWAGVPEGLGVGVASKTTGTTMGNSSSKLSDRLVRLTSGGVGRLRFWSLTGGGGGGGGGGG